GWAESAVAGDDRRDTLEQVVEVAARGGLGQGVVAVGVQVDEAGSDDKTAAVDDARLALDLALPDRDDPPAAQHKVPLAAGLTAAVVQRGATDDDGTRLGAGGWCEQQHEDQGRQQPAARSATSKVHDQSILWEIGARPRYRKVFTGRRQFARIPEPATGA